MNGIRLDINNNFKTFNGDFLIEDTDLQDQQEIIYANKGNFLEFPDLGVGITNYSSASIDKADLAKIVRKEFEKDNFNLILVTVKDSSGDDNFKINIVGERNERI